MSLMDDIICGKSAFRYWRTPPQVLMALPPLPVARDLSTRRSLADQPLAVNALGNPIETLVFDRALCSSTVNIKKHFWKGDLPTAAIQDSELCGSVASPAFTLFTLAAQIPLAHLIMATYEMCGYFTVYQPTPYMNQVLTSSGQGAYLPPGFGWRRVSDVSGNPTNLWQRDPLVELAELKALAEETVGHSGQKNFVRAIECVTGPCASPFEVQLSMLLGLPRSMGGQGLSLANNKEIRLTRAAQKIARQQRCFVDLYLESPAHERSLAIECQGAVVHASAETWRNDADRSTALQLMGLDVMQLTYRQICDKNRFDVLLQHIAKTLNMKLRPKTSRQQQAERDLWRNLFVDWETIAV